MATPKTHRIVLYRLQTDTDFSDLDLSPAGYELKYSEQDKKLFIKKSISDPPWLKYLTTILNTSEDWSNTRHSFVLLCKHETSTYALTGGSGYHCVKEICDPQFGLSISVRMIGEDQISALNQKPLKGDTQQISRVFSAYDPRLDLDNYHRLVRFVAGKGNFEGRTFTISGRSSIVLRTNRSLDDIEALFKEIEETLQKEEKINLPKSFRQVIDEDLIEKLHMDLIAKFKKFWENGGDRDTLYVEFDNPFNQLRATEYSLSVKRKRKSRSIKEFDLDLFKEALAPCKLTAHRALYDVRVSIKDEDGNLLEHLKTLYDSMAYDLVMGGRTYLKQGKDWIEILDDAKKFADHEVAKLAVEKDYMPTWSADIPNEDEYNLATAKSKQWLSIHPTKITVEGRSNIEPCDLYDPEKKRLIHVKDTWGSKASYLFLQASTSASSFSYSADFRQKVAAKWPNYFTADFHQDQITVIIALAATAEKLADFPGNLSYFAKVNLLNSIQEIRAKGFRVILAPIIRKRSIRSS